MDIPSFFGAMDIAVKVEAKNRGLRGNGHPFLLFCLFLLLARSMVFFVFDVGPAFLGIVLFFGGLGLVEGRG